jgi:hypothetical protein
MMADQTDANHCETNRLQSLFFYSRRASAPFRAILDVVPVAFPLFAPRKWAQATQAVFTGQILLADAAH